MRISIKILLLVLLFGFFIGCSGDDDEQRTESSPLIGTWKLTELLSDPGDGSGTFSQVDSERTIIFAADGSFVCNGNICTMSPDTDVPTAGTFSIADGVLMPDECSASDHEYPFELEGAALIIIYPCIEPCQAKYERL